MKIENSVVFVTGASRGLGLAFAREALARGAAKVYAGAYAIRRPSASPEWCPSHST
jgi:NAD(P)-dependent dehydrogenase (short-subunit alcohol dehydrogenase family)